MPDSRSAYTASAAGARRFGVKYPMGVGCCGIHLAFATVHRRHAAAPRAPDNLPPFQPGEEPVSKSRSMSLASQRGVSLIEVLVSLVILGLGVLSVVALQLVSKRNTGDAG